MIACVYRSRAKLVREGVQREQMLVALAQRIARGERPAALAGLLRGAGGCGREDSLK